jgi:hypothetical protein
MQEKRMTRSTFHRLAVLVAVALLAIAHDTATARADLQFRQPSVIVGEVKSGARLTRDFAFTNAATQKIEIVELQGSCGCLKPKVEPRVYQPGESGTLHAEINTLTQGAGPHSWNIHVRYRLGDEMHEQTLQLTGQIIAEISVEPSSLTIFADHAITHELLLTDSRPRPLSITSVQATSPKLTPHVTEESRNAQGQLVRHVHLDVAEDFPDGRHEEMLDIYTDDTTYRDLKVPVTIVKRPQQRFTALPAAAELSAPPGKPLPSRIVLIRDSQNETVEIDRITTSDQAIACTWARGPNTMVTLRITVDRSRLHGDSIRGSVEVRVSKSVPEIVTIPVTATVQ